MNKASLTYKFTSGYLLGTAVVCVLHVLPQFPSVAQFLLGVSIGVVGWTWLKEKRRE